MNPRIDAPRDLLFALLALQNGMIDQTALVAAFQAWTLAKERPMAEILIKQQAIDAADRALLESLVSRHIQKHNGDIDKSIVLLSTAQSIQGCLAKLDDPEINATLAQVESYASTSHSDQTVTISPGAMRDGERFRVLRPHAVGGLGAVFVALDAELNREVALKQILDNHADDPTSRSRFLLEAEITGGLEHPGIVPVYGLGLHQNGRPYYAMRFIRGESLRNAIDQFHADPLPQGNPGGRMLGLQKLLRRLLNVCDAIEYAHQRGVLHRDIKPDNIILGKHGETIVVDWGLAKPLGHRSDPKAAPGERTLMPSSSAMSGSETMRGSVLGTPTYMSPEQSTGDLDHLTTASDIYSLGATLYYLLVGKSAFQGSVTDVLEAVREGKFKHPRTIARWIAPSLEAICLKAMALKPEDRYQSARAMANDIEHWLADEPVIAYKELFRERLSRWERRHKLVVHGSFLSLVVLTLGLGITASVVRDQKRISELARQEADRRAGEARVNLTLAINTAYQLLSTVSDQQLSQIPGMTKARLTLSESAVTSFASFVSAGITDPDLLQKAASVFSNAGYTQGTVGNITKASQYFQHAIELRERREQMLEPNIGDEFKIALTEEICRYIAFLEDRGLADEATFYEFVKYRDRARSRADEVLARSRGTSLQESWRYRLAGRVDLIDGHVSLQNGELKEAADYYKKAIDRFKVSLKMPGQWFWEQLYLAHAHRGLSRVAHELGQKDVATQEFARALDIMRDVFKAKPEQIDPRYVLAWTQKIHAAQLASDPANASAATAAIDEAYMLVNDLLTKFPDEVRYRGLRAVVLVERAGQIRSDHTDSDVERDLVQAYSDLSELADWKEHENRDRRLERGQAAIALAKLRLRQGRAAEGIELLKATTQQLETEGRKRTRNIALRKTAEDARKTLEEALRHPAPRAG